MAEAVVLAAEPCDGECDTPTRHQTVSLTPSGRVRLRVVRRSYSSGEKPVVDVAPDRLVVLKQTGHGIGRLPILPPSPLPTQDEEARRKIEGQMESYAEDLRSDTITWGAAHFADLADFHAYAAKQLAKYRKKLKDLDAST
jgi:hypothetical protein